MLRRTDTIFEPSGHKTSPQPPTHHHDGFPTVHSLPIDALAKTKDIFLQQSFTMSALLQTLTTVWRPNVPESLDGKPLATTVTGLFLEFPYERLPSNPWIAFFMRPEVVVASILFYLVSKPIVKSFKDAFGLDPNSGIFRAVVAMHNLILAVFSGACAWSSWPIVISFFTERGFMAVYCDQDGSLWANGLGAWSTIFYISKFYEFVDTWILVLKGKDASFLQVYHHSGIAFIMWGAVASQSTWLLFVVLLNSVIHTLMYTYFLIKTISPTTEIKSARYLTKAQIGQFLIGIASTVGIFFLGESCDTESSRFMLACLHTYGFGLIALFVAFANRKYKKS
jgi:hypothetical protein